MCSYRLSYILNTYSSQIFVSSVHAQEFPSHKKLKKDGKTGLQPLEQVKICSIQYMITGILWNKVRFIGLVLLLGMYESLTLKVNMGSKKTDGGTVTFIITSVKYLYKCFSYNIVKIIYTKKKYICTFGHNPLSSILYNVVKWW